MVPPGPSPQAVWAVGGEDAGISHGATHMRESTPPPSETASPEASQGTCRVNQASASCLGSFSLSSANSL